MARRNRDPYSLVLACIGAALVVFVLGVAVVLATGYFVPPALWAVGGATVGILVGVLLPLPGPRSGTPNSGGTPEDSSSTHGDGGEQHAAGSPRSPDNQDAAVESAGEGLAGSPRPTPPHLVLILALVAAIGLVLSGLFYGRLVHPAGCELREFAGTPGCETPLLDFAAVLIFIASGAGGALLGIYVQRPALPQAPAEDPPPASTKGQWERQRASGPTSGGTSPGSPGGTTPSPIPLRSLVGIAAIVAPVLLVAFVLLSLLPAATTAGARVFNTGSLILTLATVGLTAVAFMSPPEKKQRWILSAILTAVLAFMSNTASGLVLNRVKNPSTGPPSVVVTAKNYFSPTVRPASATIDAGTDCAVYLANLDLLVDDEPNIAAHLPGKSLPLEQGAQSCGLSKASEINALAALLAQR